MTNLTASQTKMMTGVVNEQQPLAVIASLVFLGYVIFLFVQLGLRRGTVGPNKYGPDPLEAANPPEPEGPMNFAYLFTSLDGRINRKPYWLAALLLFAVSIAVQLGVYFASNMQVMMIVGLIFMWPSFALAVKRAHDRNRPIWLVALFFLILLATTFMQIAGVHGSANRRIHHGFDRIPRFRDLRLY